MVLLSEAWQVSDLHCCIKVLRDVRVEEEMGLHSPVQTEGDDPVLVQDQSCDGVLQQVYQTNILTVI